MTIICWDGKTLAADKRATCCGYPSTVTKISRALSGELLAFSGDLDVGRALVEWFNGGADPKSFPDNRTGDGSTRAVLMVVTLAGKIARYECLPVALFFEDRFAAMGSGRDYALAAMYLGHDARRAVEVACALDTGCGNGTDTLELQA
jgi:hypothetical protein